MKIRVATPEDAGALVEIYRPYVENTSITFEYEVPSVSEFETRIRTTLKKYPYLVAEENGEALGYAYVSAFKGRAAYDWSVETSKAGLWEKGNRKTALSGAGGHPPQAEHLQSLRLHYLPESRQHCLS